VPSKPQNEFSLYDYLPSKARIFGDAHEFLQQGNWVEGVELKQHNGKKVRRTLWVQTASHDFGWGEWGKGEGLQASLRIPRGVLRCALFYPLFWLDSVEVNSLHRHYPGRALARHAGTLLRQCDPWRPFSHATADALKAGLLDICKDWPGKKRVDAWGTPRGSEKPSEMLDGDALRSLYPHMEAESPLLEVFAELLAEEAQDGPLGGGMSFVVELRRRLVARDLHQDAVDRRIMQLCFGVYLPNEDPLEILISFFVEGVRFLLSATSGKLNALGDDAIVQAIGGLGDIVEGHLRLDVGREKTLNEMDRLILDVVHGGKRPNLGTPADYAKCLKAASLTDDHGYDLARVASAIGIKDLTSRYGKDEPAGIKRVKLYVDNGRSILGSIPERPA